MQTLRNTGGYTLLELLVVIGATGVIATIALLLYAGYVDSAGSMKTGLHFGTAVRIAEQEFVKDRQLLGIGQQGSLPLNEDEWIQRFDGDGSAVAPGGGPAFTAGIAGDPVTGAIGVIWNPDTEMLALHRPAYTGLTAATAEVTAEETRHLP